MSGIFGLCSGQVLCQPCTILTAREKAFDEKLVPALSKGAPFHHGAVGAAICPGWFKIDATLTVLDWQSLEKRLNQPKSSAQIQVTEISAVREKKEGEKKYIVFSIVSAPSEGLLARSASWLMGKRDGKSSEALESKESELQFEAENGSDHTDWLYAFQEMTAVYVPRLKEKLARQETDSKRLAAKRDIMEARQQQREKQLKALGPVGLKVSAQIMMDRDKRKQGASSS